MNCVNGKPRSSLLIESTDSISNLVYNYIPIRVVCVVCDYVSRMLVVHAGKSYKSAMLAKYHRVGRLYK